MPEQNIDMDDINGKLMELMELNSALTTRCATMRGQIAKKDAEIARLKQQQPQSNISEVSHPVGNGSGMVTHPV